MKNKKIRIILATVSVALNAIALVGFLHYIKEKDDGIDYNEKETKELSNKVENSYPVHIDSESDDSKETEKKGEDTND